MADVLIRGMEMPKACFKCRLLDSYFWQCEITKKTASHSADCVPSYCPLVPVPPHGRLIDADEADDYAYDELEVSNSYLSPREASRNMQLIYKNMPTIIPASEEAKE